MTAYILVNMHTQKMLFFLFLYKDYNERFDKCQLITPQQP